MELVDYVDTFIAVADDSPAAIAMPPPLNPASPSVAARMYHIIAEHPYEFTSGDVIFAVFADRRGIPDELRAAARTEFYSVGLECLRSSALGQRYGWGIHADANGLLALYGVGGPPYAELVTGRRRTGSAEPVTVIKAMRSARAIKEFPRSKN